MTPSASPASTLSLFSLSSLSLLNVLPMIYMIWIEFSLHLQQILSQTGFCFLPVTETSITESLIAFIFWSSVLFFSMAACQLLALLTKPCLMSPLSPVLSLAPSTFRCPLHVTHTIQSLLTPAQFCSSAIAVLSSLPLAASQSKLSVSTSPRTPSMLAAHRPAPIWSASGITLWVPVSSSSKQAPILHHLPVTWPVSRSSFLPQASMLSPTVRLASPHTVMVAISPCLQAAGALLPKPCSSPVVLTVPPLPFQPSPGFLSFPISAPSLAFEPKCSISCLTHHLLFTAEC